MRQVFTAFLRLGLTSFGGPVAHLAYFRDAFVVKRRWLTERDYADLVALSQFLPGPTSSQVGMAIGLRRAGGLGMLAAWVAFTLPSAALLVAFAYGAPSLTDTIGTGWISGIKAATVAVVAHAVISMARTLTPDAKRASIALFALVAVVLAPHALTQLAVILGAAAIGALWLRAGHDDPPTQDAVRPPRSRRAATTCLALFALALASLPVLAAARDNGAISLIDSFYRAGALVFGGGHVVLPLLHADVVPTLVSDETFLAGYGAAQAVPGPLFTFAAYLGAASTQAPSGILGATLALTAIFAPAALLIAGTLPFWERLRTHHSARAVVMGVNAGVVGILGAALYSPVFTQGIEGPPTLAIAAAAYVAIAVLRMPAWVSVLAAAIIGALAL